VIQRFCFIKLHDSHVESRDDYALRLRALFEEAGVEALVGVPADDSAVRWDVSIAITAASLDAWHVLARTPKVAEIFDELSERANVMTRWTFQVGAAGSELGE
jgi:hypothetical protein